MILLVTLCLSSLCYCLVEPIQVVVHSEGSNPIQPKSNVKPPYALSGKVWQATYPSVAVNEKPKERIINTNVVPGSHNPTRKPQNQLIFTIPTLAKIVFKTTFSTSTIKTITTKSWVTSNKVPSTVTTPLIDNQTDIATAAKNRTIGISLGVVAFVFLVVAILLAVRYYKSKRRSKPQITTVTITKLPTHVFNENNGDLMKMNCTSNGKPLDTIKPVYATVEYLPPTRCSQLEELPALSLVQQLGDYEVISE